MQPSLSESIHRPAILFLFAALAFLPLFSRSAVQQKTQRPDLTFRDLSGRSHTVAAQDDLPAVYLFLSTECMICNTYSPRIRALAQSCEARSIHVFGIYPDENEGAGAVERSAKERGYAFPLAKDDGQLARRFGVRTTPEAVVLDRQGEIRYRGLIDDSTDGSQVRHRYVSDALEAVLAGRAPAVMRTRAVGCAIRLPSQSSPVTHSVTYARNVEPILRHNCVPCHRPGEVAPFSLATYRQAASWAGQIADYTNRRIMPPWKADSHGEFTNERRLTDAQIALLGAWAKAGAPLGNPKQLRQEPPLVKGWALGLPDAEFEPDQSYTLAADGADVYRCFVIPTHYTTDRYVSALEVRPGNRAVVHHVLVYLDTTGAARKLQAASTGAGYTASGGGPGFTPTSALGGWAPGITPDRLPEGVGMLLPAGADIVLQVHYHKDGKPENDRTRIGLSFCRGPVTRRLYEVLVFNPFLRIPADDASYITHASSFVSTDVTVLNVTPHMHLLGREITVTATLPDGTLRRLVHVPDWDFNWQTIYTFRKPVKLPRGTRINLEARYDNSGGNPRNPNHPTRMVTWGEQTTDEMCLAFVGVTADAEDIGKGLIVKDLYRLAPRTK